MKKYIYRIFILLFLIIYCSGCKSTDNTEFKILVSEYMSTNGNLLLKYLENDSTLSRRDKEIYIIRHRILEKNINVNK